MRVSSSRLTSARRFSMRFISVNELSISPSRVWRSSKSMSWRRIPTFTSPSYDRAPSSGRKSPESTFIRVVLPAPFLPARPILSPLFILKLTPEKSVSPENTTAMLLAESIRIPPCLVVLCSRKSSAALYILIYRVREAVQNYAKKVYGGGSLWSV